MEYIMIFIVAVFVNNVVLSQFLGEGALCGRNELFLPFIQIPVS